MDDRKKKLACALLNCLSIIDNGSRKQIIGALPEPIRHRIIDSGEPRVIVKDIVDKVTIYDYGLYELVKIMYHFEKGSIPGNEIGSLYEEHILEKVLPDLEYFKVNDMDTDHLALRELKFYIDTDNYKYDREKIERVRTKLKEIYHKLLEDRIDREDWAGACKALDELCSIDLSNQEYEDICQRIEEEKHLSDLYQKACSHFDNQEYQDAVIEFANVVSRDAYYKDADQKLFDSLKMSPINIESNTLSKKIVYICQYLRQVLTAI